MADITTDARYKQIQAETEQESNTQKSKSAFQGFGRSTDLSDKVTKIEGEGQKRVAALANVIALESLAAQGLDVSKALGAAYQALNQLAQQASSRRSSLSGELSQAGQSAESDLQNLFKTSAKKFSSTPHSKSSKSLNRKNTTPKTFNLSKALKELPTKAPVKFAKTPVAQKSIKSIISTERSKKLSS